MALDRPLPAPMGGGLVALARAAHAAPTLAVTLIATVLVLAVELPSGTSAVLISAVFTGQLSIGWSNDLIDLTRDRAAHREDKPLVASQVSASLVAGACAMALITSVSLSAMLGWPAGAAHLLVLVGGWSYNLWLKRTAWSWVAYAVAFGALATVPSLAAGQADTAASAVGVDWWLPLTGALLGVGAHLLNVLPDLADDRATGVSGLPHRIANRFGARRVTQLAAGLLLGATAVLLSVVAMSPVVVAGSVVVVSLTVVVLRGTGRTPFLAAMVIAVVDVALLAVAV